MLVQPLGERFGEAIGERLQQDVRIIVLVGAEAFRMRLEAVKADREAAHPVARRIDKIGQAPLGAVAALLELLARSEERRVGKECVSKGRYRRSRFHQKNTNTT